jgi:dihydroorotase
MSGRAVFADGVRWTTIEVDPETGCIASVKCVDEAGAGNTLLFPGFVDIHVHAREYPLPPKPNPDEKARWEAVLRKETFLTAGQAAINGGVTLFAAMPNDPVPPDNREDYERKMHLAANSPCPAVIMACITDRSEPWADIPYKVYLDVASSSVSFDSWRSLEASLSRYGGCRVFFHAEDPKILEKHRHLGPRWRSRPPEAEIVAVEKILELTAKFGLHSHICHVSTEKALLLIGDYNSRSEKKVTCEATPHHLFFSIREGAVHARGGHRVPAADLLECNPPLRSEADRQFVLAGLKEGLVDVLATDHAPHTLEDKKSGAAGMPHLDTLGPFVGWLIKECGFLPARIAEILSAGPSRILAPDLPLKHGRIEETWAASFTLLDMNGTTLVEAGKIKDRGPLKTLCRWSPFEGIELPATVRTCVVRGRQYSFPQN